MAASYLLLFVALFVLQNAQAFTEEQKAEIKAKLSPIVIECAKKNGGITEEYLKEFREQKKRPDDTNSCFFACAFKEIDLLDAQGLFSEEKAVENGLKYAKAEDADKVREAAKTCAKVNQESVSDGDKGCDRAKLLYNCITEQKEQYFGLFY